MKNNVFVLLDICRICLEAALVSKDKVCIHCLKEAE